MVLFTHDPWRRPPIVGGDDFYRLWLSAARHYDLVHTRARLSEGPTYRLFPSMRESYGIGPRALALVVNPS